MDVSARPDRLRTIALLNGGIGLMVIGIGTTLLSLIIGSGSLLFIVGPLAWVIAAYHGVFHAHITRDEFRVVPIALISAGLAAFTVTSVGWAAGAIETTLAPTLLGTAITGASLLGGIFVGRMALRSIWRRGRFRSTAVVAGSGPVTSELVLELTHRTELGIDVDEFIDLDEAYRSTGDVSRVIRALRTHRPDRLVIGDLSLNEHELLPAVRFAGTIGTRVYVLPRLFSMGVGNPLFSPDRLRGFPLQRVNRPAHPRLGLAIKRAIDIAASAGVLLVCMPLLIVVGALIKLTSRGPLLFWQERLGQNGRIIRIPKFRSMTASDTSDFEWTASDRITPIGQFLRRSAIDEIPQLWSVLRGDMSLVGPRPERPAFASQFALELSEYDARHRMRVGLTGLAQIAGLRGDTSISERAKYDNLYIDQWSLTGDLMIVLRTVGAIVGERRREQAQLDFEAALASLQQEQAKSRSTEAVVDARHRAVAEVEANLV